MLGFVYILFFVILIFVFHAIWFYWKERLAARAWWEEQSRAERKIDKRYGF